LFEYDEVVKEMLQYGLEKPDLFDPKGSQVGKIKDGVCFTTPKESQIE